jgi:hypothetical protein
MTDGEGRSSPPALDPGEPERTTDPSTRRDHSRGIVVIVIVVAVAIAAAIGALRDREPAPERGPETTAAKGTACALLFEASERREAGDADGFTTAVREASRVAERALERSGVVFGAAERTAIQLRHDVDQGDDAAIESGLARAARACRSIDSWPPAAG